MEFSTEVLEGLQLAGDSTHISDENFPILLQKVCESALDKLASNSPLEEKALSSVNPGVLKQAHSALLTLVLEAARHDRDAAAISHVLEDCKYTNDRIDAFSSIYQNYKNRLQALLSSTGNNPQHIVDVDWRLDYYIKNNQMEKVNEPTYLINLKTEEPGNPDLKQVQFACSQEQLQDLVGKLRDACKSLERASQM